ncbi:MAG: tandem-95 repeat protein, partial [Deltaproteobacteria bacterium]|nr:tandem-95 repeat protein [Deltaproteobacteria bacterium]
MNRARVFVWILCVLASAACKPSFEPTSTPEVTGGNTAIQARSAPKAQAQKLSTRPDTALTIRLDDTVVGPHPLTYHIVTKPLHGKLSGSLPNVVYTPHSQYTGTDKFSFRIYDGIVYSNVATIKISVSDVNHAPVAQNQDVVTNQDSPVGIVLGATDADGDSLNYQTTASPSHGTLSGNGVNLSYTPSSGFSGADTFSFRAFDGVAYSDVATISISVNRVNHAPVAQNQSISTNQDTQVAITVGATDADADPLTYQVENSPAHGTLSGTSPNLLYVPNAAFSGTDNFQFKASDGRNPSNIATVTIVVSHVNHDPQAQDQSVSILQRGSKAISLAATDADNDPLTYRVVSGPAHGSLGGSAPSLTYIPENGYAGSDHFTFQAFDGVAYSNTATVLITLEANQAPVAQNQSVSTLSHTSVSIRLSAVDPDADLLTYQIASQPLHGTLGGTDHDKVYTPNALYVGADSFTFRAYDGIAYSDIATVSVAVIESNHEPVAQSLTLSTDKNIALSFSMSATDADSDVLTYEIYEAPSHGTLSGDLPHLVYTPNTGFVGREVFTFRANDGMAFSNVARVELNVRNVYEPPVARDKTVRCTVNDGYQSISINLSEFVTGSNHLIFEVVTNPSRGQLRGSGPYFYYSTDSCGPDSFTYRVHDGGNYSNVATVNIAINHKPSAVDHVVSTDRDTPVSITLTATDEDGDALTYRIGDSCPYWLSGAQSPLHGQLSGTPPNLTYTPDAGYSGSDRFTYCVFDGWTYSSPLKTITLFIDNAGTWNIVNSNAAPFDLFLAVQSKTFVWIGSQLFGFSGADGDGAKNSFGVFDPTSNSWRRVSSKGAPLLIDYASLVWTGSEVIVWGGEGLWNEYAPRKNGKRYHPSSDTWRSMADAPVARVGHAAVWTGSRMIVWGGMDYDFDHCYLKNNAKAYDPAGNKWYNFNSVGAPSPRANAYATWVGGKMVIFGGSNDECGFGRFLMNGGIYTQATNSWTPIASPGAPPSSNENSNVFFVGNKMVVYYNNWDSKGCRFYIIDIL